MKIHEPRYRMLIRDVVDAGGFVAVGLPVDCSAGDPGLSPVRPYVCVSYIAKHQNDPSGASLLLLQGIRRAQIMVETHHEPYRKVVVDPVSAPMGLEIDLVEHRQQIESLLSDPILKNLSSVSAIHNWLNAEIPTAVLIDLAVMTVCSDTEQRYQMLAEPELDRRAEWLIKFLRDTRKTLQVAEKFRPPELADHLQLN